MRKALRSRPQGLLLVILSSILGACGGGDQQSAPVTEATGAGGSPEPVVVYSARAEQLIKPIFDAYTAETGVPIRYTTDSEQPLIQKLLAEGETTPADLLMTVDAGNLWYAAEQGTLRPTYSDVLEANIPEHLRDPGNRWFALSVRARTIVYDTRDVDPSELSDYRGLAEEKWQGKLCLRTSEKVYNQSLVAMLIADHGEEQTERTVRGWVENLATDVFSNDTSLIEAIAAGQCDVGIVNTYYFGRLQKENPDIPVAIFWPPAETGGVHVNVSGAGVTRHAKNPEGAVALLEWMSSATAQKLLGGENMEYPANPDIEPHPVVAAWGTFKANPMNVARAGEYQADAVRLMDRAGYR
ncbi:MAG TPA: extracellular solute-binding protein [Woeseiaceae bacterium]|nr:extracellular solute-binding protein [Woeseiaceae bacterium]